MKMVLAKEKSFFTLFNSLYSTVLVCVFKRDDVVVSKCGY